MKKSKIFLLHFIYWAFYFLIGNLLILIILGFIFNLGKSHHTTENLTALKEIKILSYISYAIPALTSYMISYFFIFKKFIENSWKISVVTLLNIFVSVLINLIVCYFVWKTFKVLNQGEYSAILGLIVFFTIIISFINAIMGLVVKGFTQWFSEVKMKRELEKQNHQMELDLVKSQLDPHFLFNSINNIDVLIHKDPTKASQFLNKLSDIMRFMLFEAKSEKITIDREIIYIEKYLDLQRVRTSNENYINFSKEILNENLLIDPMLFIPFIENACKYSESLKKDEAVKIEIKQQKNKIIFKCENKFNPNEKVISNGIGESLIRKRLDLIFKDQYNLEIKSENSIYSVYLEINENN